MLTTTRRRAATALIVVALVWLGVLFGVSFLATPAKFLAPSLSLPVALDVGRQTFRLYSTAEAVVATGALLLGLATARRPLWILSGALAALVAIQLLWLLPALDARVETLLSGGSLAESSLHTLYIGFDAAKCVLLALLARGAFQLRFDADR